MMIPSPAMHKAAPKINRTNCTIGSGLVGEITLAKIKPTAQVAIPASQYLI